MTLWFAAYMLVGVLACWVADWWTADCYSGSDTAANRGCVVLAVWVVLLPPLVLYVAVRLMRTADRPS